MLMNGVTDEGWSQWLRILHVRGQVSIMMNLPPPPPPSSSWFPDNVYFKNVDLRSLSQYGVCFLATTLFMQYVILRVALHEVLIVIALGHVEANVKLFGKKIKIKTIFKVIISKRFQMKKNLKNENYKSFSISKQKNLKKI